MFKNSNKRICSFNLSLGFLFNENTYTTKSSAFSNFNNVYRKEITQKRKTLPICWINLITVRKRKS